MRNEGAEKQNAVVEKSKAFALRIISMYKFLTAEKKEFVLSKQILRSGTSIGANIAEAQCAISRKDFLAKMYIAFKECSETAYWLELLYRSDYITKTQYVSLQADCNALYQMLSAITRTIRNEELVVRNHFSFLIPHLKGGLAGVGFSTLYRVQ